VPHPIAAGTAWKGWTVKGSRLLPGKMRAGVPLGEAYGGAQWAAAGSARRLRGHAGKDSSQSRGAVGSRVLAANQQCRSLGSRGVMLPGSSMVGGWPFAGRQ
jgi:hypothetical protein